MKTLTASLSQLLANTYALYLKTQCYHWHVKGPHFSSLHALFESQYRQLSEAVDVIAERIRMIGSNAPASFSELNRLKTHNDGDPNAAADLMVHDLLADHQALLTEIGEVMAVAEHVGDEGTISLLGDRIVEHEKSAWILNSSK